MSPDGSCTKMICFLLVLCLAMPYPLSAQSNGNVPEKFSREQLAQMLAPIALYPDSLLSQVLMASTYPLEVVEADRWVRANPQLKGAALDDALRDMSWDVSVKSLCFYPAVLAEMSRRLDRTSRLGDAFLSQEDDVMDVVQELRRKAYESGNLRSTSEQTLTVDGGYYNIAPASPDIIYVPAYDPGIVYGSWWYPAYPPYRWDYPWYGIGRAIYFGTGFIVGIAVSSWSWCDWRGHRVNYALHKTARFHRVSSAATSTAVQVWSHDPYHRRGVAYRNPSVGRRFGQRLPTAVEPRRDVRGYIGPSPGSPQRDFDRGSTGSIGSRPGVRQPERLQQPAPPQRRESFQPGSGVDRGRTQGGAVMRDNAFRGDRSGFQERRASERGRASRDSFRERDRRPESPQSAPRGGSGGRGRR